MKKLLLIRHGKSDWLKNDSDQFRTLNETGIRRTNLVANRLHQLLDFTPEHIYSSIATRAKQTAEITRKIVFPKKTITYDKELYTFSHFVLKKWIKNLDSSTDHAIIFGHNPAFTDIAYELGSEFILNIPTSGIVWIEFDTNHWTQIEKGETKHIILPKDLG